jgi:hypothetical protein
MDADVIEELKLPSRNCPKSREGELEQRRLEHAPNPLGEGCLAQLVVGRLVPKPTPRQLVVGTQDIGQPVCLPAAEASHEC